MVSALRVAERFGVPPVSASAIYAGTIRHRRPAPAGEFTHRLALAYVDLAELPSLLGGRLLHRGPGLLRFRRRDYLGAAATPLDTAVRDRVEELSAPPPRRPDPPAHPAALVWPVLQPGQLLLLL